MIPNGLKLALGATLSLGLVLAVRLVARPLVQVRLPEAAQRRQVVTENSPRAPIDSLAAATVSRDPFRITHRPAAVAYDPVRLAEQVAPATPKPVLQLVGIVWEGGRDPTALVDGLPGIEGVRVVKLGDVVAGLRVRSITAKQIRIVGMDTTWVLKVRDPWR